MLRWWPFAVVAATWLVVATQQIGLPGVYMDAVNPDYLVVRLLNRHAQTITTWLPGGNYSSPGRPVSVQLYHGFTAGVARAAFFALFGTTVTGLRLTHAMFALGILAALYAMLTRGGVSRGDAALAGVALAVDPAFSYAFRTQSYITLAPTAAVPRAVRIAAHFVTGAPAARWLVTSGVFYGLLPLSVISSTRSIFPRCCLRYGSGAATSSDGPSERWLRAWLPALVGGLALGGTLSTRSATG